MTKVLSLEQVAEWDGPGLVLFIGIATGGSAAHGVFPPWAGLLGREWVLRGVDLPANASDDSYRRLLASMKQNAHVVGAVVTSHKIRLRRAAGDLLTAGDRLVDLTGEVNTVVAGDPLTGYAVDAVSLDHVLPEVTSVPAEELSVLCFGAGGAAAALLLSLFCRVDGSTVKARESLPKHVTFADTRGEALRHLGGVADQAGIDPSRLTLTQVRSTAEADGLLRAVPAPCLVVNATGLGKTGPGSPISPQARFPPGATAWDFNYRGELTFLRQAESQAVAAIDGWRYFLAGWAGALATIAGAPLTAPLIERFEQTAKSERNDRDR